jgi:hypothetical protein
MPNHQESRLVIVTARRAAQNEGGALSLVCFLNASYESAKRITTSEYQHCHLLPNTSISSNEMRPGRTHPTITVLASKDVSFVLPLASYGPEIIPSLSPEFRYFLIVHRSQRVLALLAAAMPNLLCIRIRLTLAQRPIICPLETHKRALEPSPNQ